MENDIQKQREKNEQDMSKEYRNQPEELQIIKTGVI